MIALACSVSFSLPSFAQRNSDPNLGHFYMGRQQVQVIDDSPVVTNKSGSAGGGNNMNGALPGRPAPLPAAGWQSFSPATSPGLNRSLPKVNNGVPPKDAPAGPTGHKGKTGKLTAGKSTAKLPAPSTQSGPAAYKPYATYSNANAANGSGATNQQSSSNVKGSVLHWARGAHRNN